MSHINVGENQIELLVAQNALQALNVAQRGYVLQTGRVVLSGPSDQLRKDEAIVAAYLGTSRIERDA